MLYAFARMKGFLLGLLVAGLLFGGYLYWQQQNGYAEGCRAGTDGEAGGDCSRRRRRRGGVRGG